ncbi:unnamed protein product, partial [Calicophoron daubneyi]
MYRAASPRNAKSTQQLPPTSSRKVIIAYMRASTSPRHFSENKPEFSSLALYFKRPGLKAYLAASPQLKVSTPVRPNVGAEESSKSLFKNPMGRPARRSTRSWYSERLPLCTHPQLKTALYWEPKNHLL